jgi:hypothetical protein
MWVVKCRGNTYYVHHVTCTVAWNTKETPDNPHTKGSIKIKNCLITIDDDNCAQIDPLTVHDQIRLRNQQLGITRIIIQERWINHLKQAIDSHNIKHSPFKSIGGACTRTFYICDILKKTDLTMLFLKLSHTDIRELMPNEAYYKWYSNPKYKATDD